VVRVNEEARHFGAPNRDEAAVIKQGGLAVAQVMANESVEDKSEHI
jgi:hypothetical protein